MKLQESSHKVPAMANLPVAHLGWVFFIRATEFVTQPNVSGILNRKQNEMNIILNHIFRHEKRCEPANLVRGPF